VNQSSVFQPCVYSLNLGNALLEAADLLANAAQLLGDHLGLPRLDMIRCGEAIVNGGCARWGAPCEHMRLRPA